MNLLRGLPSEIETRVKYNKSSSIDVLILNLSPKCDYRCRMCYVQKKETKGGLTLPQIQNTIKQATQLGIESVIIPGEGEPLLDKNIEEIIKFNHKNKLTTIIYSNASRLTTRIAKIGKEKDVTWIMNVPSLEKETYEYLTRKDNSFDQTINNINNIKEVYGKNSNRLAINFVVTRKTKREVRKFREFCGDYLLFICSYPVFEGNACINWNEIVGSEINTLQKISKTYSDIKGQTMGLNGNCGFRDHGLTITYNGEVIPCPASREVIGSIGNIKEVGLKKVHEKVVDKLAKFFNKYEISPCLVRHKHYNKFIEMARDNNSKI